MNNNLHCTAVDNDNLKLELSQPLRIEQPISFNIMYPKGWEIVNSKARLVGVNMYMGKIPVLLENNPLDASLEGQLLIVACTRPDMVWQLELEVELTNAQRISAHWPFLMTNME